MASSTTNVYQGDYDARFRGPERPQQEVKQPQFGLPRREFNRPDYDRNRERVWDRDRWGQGRDFDWDRQQWWKDVERQPRRDERFQTRDFNRFGSEFSSYGNLGRGYGYDRDFGRDWGYGRDFGGRDFYSPEMGRKEWGRGDIWGQGRDFGRDWGTYQGDLGREFDRNFGQPANVDTGFYGESRRGTSGNTWRNYGKRGAELPFFQGWWRPRADILDEEGNIRVEFELPGVPKDNISLTIGEDFIIVQCVKPESQKEMKGFYYQNERHFGNFYRRLELPDFVNTNQCSAILQSGVLKITCPKSLAGGEGGTKSTEGTKQPLRNKINIREMGGQTAPGGGLETLLQSK